MGFWRDFLLGPESLTAAAAAASAPAEARATQGTTSGIIPPTRDAGGPVTVDQALSIGSVYRAVGIIVTSVAQMDLRVLRSGVVIPTPSLVANPNVNDTRTAFVEETVWSLACHGNAYWRIVRDGNRAVQSIEVLDPAAVGVNLDPESGRVTYTYLGREMPRDKIRHLRLMRRPGQPLGLGPIQAARGELTGALRLRAFADSWFDTHNTPTGTLTTDQVLSPEESAEYAEAWKRFLAEHQGIAVLSQGLAYDTVQLDPAKAQYIDVQRENTKQIARLFGVPAMHLLADTGTSNTYLNLEQANIVFLQTTLARYMREIENALTDLLPRGQQVRFSEEDLLRMDSKVLWEVRRIQLETGARTVNEVRAKDSLPAVPWGDEKPAVVTARPGSDQGATNDETEDGDAA